MSRMISLSLALAWLASTPQLQADDGCPIEEALSKLPKVTYMVGKEAVCCPQAAAKLAAEAEAAVIYLVGDEKFADESVAKLALVEATEKFVEEFGTPCRCEVSGKTTIAGAQLTCDVMAGERAKLVQEAMKNVQLTYVVGDESCHCPLQAAELAKSSGNETLFVVGKEKTDCSVTARLNLARAKYIAAVEAIVKADNNVEAKEDAAS